MPSPTSSNFIDESKIVLSQLAKPDGFYGEIVASCLSTTFESVNRWAVDLMQVRPNETVLEIGFGTGHAIQELVNRTQASHVIGIDSASLMVQKATQLNQKAIQSGKVQLLKADVADLPAFTHKFDHVLAVNSVMYWPQHKLSRILKALKSQMAPGGRIYFVMQRHFARFERGDFNAHIQELLTHLTQAGFIEVSGTRQQVTDRQAAIDSGLLICLAIHGTNPAFCL
jgi:cyclopropane fatty-acyl-phospholipid synthase-like methyltransferase